MARTAEIKNLYIGSHPFEGKTLKQKLFAELTKFGIVGIINTAVDFGLFNALIMIFGVDETGPKFILFKSISFFVAVTGSFFLNKHFVFKREKEEARGEKNVETGTAKVQAAKFLTISLFGLLINSLVAYAVFATGHYIFGSTNAQFLANIGALAGTALVLVSNFIGYKYFVFKK
jgi:putative flippase GtrA